MGDNAELQNILQAITALYHHDDRNVKDQANKWLQSWQQTTSAWSTSDVYLHSNSNNMEADYFFAQTLKLKVDCLTNTLKTILFIVCIPALQHYLFNPRFNVTLRSSPTQQHSNFVIACFSC